jgi:hypothetical protein
MNQKVESPAELHADHRTWQSDISMWNFDLEQWRSEHAAALKQLQEITELIQRHEKMLKEHEQSVEMIEAGLEFHEKNLAKSLQSGAESDVDDALVERHTEEAGKFAKQREAHERIKKHHHIAMAHVASLKRELEATTQF